MGMTRIEREKQAVETMIWLYCRRQLKTNVLPTEYAELLSYAHKRLDCCKFGENKTSCKKCPVHCYAPAKRELIRQVMRWAGPRMLIYHPLIAIRHLLDK